MEQFEKVTAEPSSTRASRMAIDVRMRRCIELCQACEAICVEVTHLCLRQGGKHAEPAYVNLILACAEACRTSARLMLLRSEFHLQFCEAAADVCDACEDACVSRGADPVMKHLLAALRRCADSCREMAGRPSRRPRIRKVLPATLASRRPHEAVTGAARKVV